jgi:excisionase family DNA binding protein
MRLPDVKELNRVATMIKASNTMSTRSRPSSRILVPEIAGRLSIGRLAVYEMLELRIIPGIRLGRRWIITRHAYEQWEQTCGVRQVPATGYPER